MKSAMSLNFYEPQFFRRAFCRARIILPVAIFLTFSCDANPSPVCADAQKPLPMSARRTDEAWAQSSGLSLDEVRRLRRLAEVPDEETDLYIANLDAANLASRSQILVVNSDAENHCRVPFVFARNGKDFRLVFPEKMPNESVFCYETSGSPPTIRATREGKISVEIPFINCAENCNGCVKETKISTYQWNGATYRFQGERSANDE